MGQYLWYGIFIVAAIFLVSMSRKRNVSGVARISPDEVKKRLETEKGITLLDVRDPDEYASAHIPKSKLMPVNILEREAERKLPDKNAEIIVYCASGARSSAAARILSGLGYTKVYNMGGISRWPYETVSGKK